MGSVALFVPHVGCPQQCSFCDQRAITGGAQAPAPQQEETLSAPQKEKAPKEEPKQTVTPAQASPVEEKAPAAAQTEEAAPQETPTEGKAVDYEARIRAFLTGLLEQMGVEATITVGPRTENGIPVTLDGPKLGAVIGHRGTPSSS